jgi:hypothetical protein
MKEYNSHILIDDSDYYSDDKFYQEIKKDFINFDSLMYGKLIINKIPNNIAYSHHDPVVCEACPAPNPYGCEIFDIDNFSHENFTIVIKTTGKKLENNMKIKLKLDLKPFVNCKNHMVYLHWISGGKKFFAKLENCEKYL